MPTIATAKGVAAPIKDNFIIIIIIIRGFIVRLLQVIGALRSHPNCQQTQKAKLKECVLSRFLKSPGSLAACKSFGSEFHADGLAYMKARSPNLVLNHGREKSNDLNLFDLSV